MLGGMSWGVAAVVLVLFVASQVLLRKKRVDISAVTVAFAPLNRMRFGLRRALSFSRGAPVLPHEPKDDLFSYLEGDAKSQAEARAKDLRARYALTTAETRTTRQAFRENLYVLDLLDTHVTPHMKRADAITAVDVGSKDFVYAPALSAFAQQWSDRTPDLTGVEIDGHVIYKDLRSRADYAAAWAKVAGPGTRYCVSDFLAFAPDAEVTLLTIFYPFVTRFALLRWGLPASEYRPEALLQHAAKMLAADGVLVIVNHTHEERDILRALMDQIPQVTRVHGADITCSLVDYFEDVPERSLSVYVRA
jgi:SAM-dependent methyltransferase